MHECVVLSGIADERRLFVYVCVFLCRRRMFPLKWGNYRLIWGVGREGGKVCVRCVLMPEVQAENALACVKQTEGVRSQVTYLRVCSHVTSWWGFFFFQM